MYIAPAIMNKRPVTSIYNLTKINVIIKMDRPYRRRILIIKKPLQYRFITFTFLSVFFAVLLIGFDIYYTAGEIIVKSIDPEALPKLEALNAQLLVKLLFYMILVLFLSVIFSHKIAGPIYRFERSCEVVGSGDFTYRVKLRKGDLLKDFMNSFNRMIENLQDMVKKDRALVEEISRNIENIAMEVKDRRDELIEISKNIKKITSSYRI